MLSHMLIWCKNYRPSATLYFLPVFFLSIVFFYVIEIHSMNIFVTWVFFPIYLNSVFWFDLYNFRIKENALCVSAEKDNLSID